MTNNPTPEQMARRIADARYSSSERPGSWMVAYDAALAAIIKTTELAAKHVGAIRIGYEKDGINADPLGVAADALRSGAHLKGSSDGR